MVYINDTYIYSVTVYGYIIFDSRGIIYEQLFLFYKTRTDYMECRE